MLWHTIGCNLVRPRGRPRLRWVFHALSDCCTIRTGSRHSFSILLLLPRPGGLGVCHFSFALAGIHSRSSVLIFFASHMESTERERERETDRAGRDKKVEATRFTMAYFKRYLLMMKTLCFPNCPSARVLFALAVKSAALPASNHRCRP